MSIYFRNLISCEVAFDDCIVKSAIQIILNWMIKNRCFRTLILKLVNSLELLEDRMAIDIWIDFYVHP